MADPTEKQLGEKGRGLNDMPTEVLEMIGGYLSSQGAVRSLSNWASTSRHYHQCLARQVFRSIQVTNIQERSTSLDLALATASRNWVDKISLLAIYRNGSANTYNRSIPSMLLGILPERNRFPYLKSIDIYIEFKALYHRHLDYYILEGVGDTDLYNLMEGTWNELTTDIKKLEEVSWHISYIPQSKPQSAEKGPLTTPLAIAARDTIHMLGTQALQAQEIQVNPAANLLEGMRGQNVTLRSRLCQCQGRPSLSVLRLNQMCLPAEGLRAFLICNQQLKTISMKECACTRPHSWNNLFQTLSSLPKLTVLEIEDSSRYYREIPNDIADNDAAFLLGMVVLRAWAQRDPNYKIFPYVKNDGSTDVEWSLGLASHDNVKYWETMDIVKGRHKAVKTTS